MRGEFGSTWLSVLAVLLLAGVPSVGLAVSVCGNGVTDDGEECDSGAENGNVHSCCAADCTLLASGTTCASATECTLESRCAGSTADCPPVVPADAGSPCGDNTSNACTTPDSCDGLGACVTNDAPFGTPALDFCDDGDACTTAECNGSGGCMNRSVHIMSTGFETDEPPYVCPLTMGGLVRLDSF